MIDESKYEGHTEGKWEYNSATILATAKGGNEIIAEYPCWNYNKDQLITKEEETNLRLMADAPLLLAEVKRLKKVIEIMSYRMNPVDEGCTLHEEKLCGGIEGKCFLCEEIKALQRGPYVWGENAPKSEAFYLEDGVWKEQEGDEE